MVSNVCFSISKTSQKAESWHSCRIYRSKVIVYFLGESANLGSVFFFRFGTEPLLSKSFSPGFSRMSRFHIPVGWRPSRVGWRLSLLKYSKMVESCPLDLFGTGIFPAPILSARGSLRFGLLGDSNC